MAQEDWGAGSYHCQLELAKVTKQNMAWFKAPCLSSVLPKAWVCPSPGLQERQDRG